MSKKTSTAKTSNTKKNNKKKPNTVAIVSASVAAIAAGAYYTYSKGSWPFGGKKTGASSAGKKAGSAQPGAPKGAAADVDVALTNEVAESTLHNPNNAGDFTDDGATGNAD